MTNNFERWHVSAEDYHAESEHESSTTIKMYLDNPYAYSMRRAGKYRADQSDEMTLGIAFHRLMEEGSGILKKLPQGMVRRGVAWEEFKGACDPSHIIVSQDEYDKLMGMAEAVHANPYATDLLKESAERELSVRWTDPLSGVGLKCRFDVLTDSGKVLCYKTTSRPGHGDWSNEIGKYKYHIQAALYCRGRDGILAFDAPSTAEFYHIVVSSTPPYEAYVRPISLAAIHCGNREIDCALLVISMLGLRSNVVRCHNRGWGYETRGSSFDLPSWYVPYGSEK